MFSMYYSLLFITSAPLLWHYRQNCNFCTDCGHSSLSVQLSFLCNITIPPHHWMQPDGPGGLPQLHHPLSCWSGWELSVFALNASNIKFILYVIFTFCLCVCSWSDQPLESPPVPADLEDCTCNCYRQHSGCQTQWDDLCDHLDDVQVDAAGWYDNITHNVIATHLNTQIRDYSHHDHVM